PLAPGERGWPQGETATLNQVGIGDQSALEETKHRLGLVSIKRREYRDLPTASLDPHSQAQQAGSHRDAEPSLGVDLEDLGVGEGQPLAMGELEDVSGHGRLAKQCDRRPLLDQLLHELEPNRLADVEVRGSSPCLEASQPLDVP